MSPEVEKLDRQRRFYRSLYLEALEDLDRAQARLIAAGERMDEHIELHRKAMQDEEADHPA